MLCDVLSHENNLDNIDNQDSYENNTINGNSDQSPCNKVLHKPKKSRISDKLEMAQIKKTMNSVDPKGIHTSSTITEETSTAPGIIFITINVVIEHVVKTTSITINQSESLLEVIRQGINGFNELFKQEKTNFRLQEDPTLYGLKQVKKNGYPKQSMPAYNTKISLRDTDNVKFCLVWLASPEDYKTYFYTIDIKDKKNQCNECIIW